MRYTAIRRDHLEMFSALLDEAAEFIDSLPQEVKDKAKLRYFLFDELGGAAGIARDDASPTAPPPEGYKLLKNSTQDERSYYEDAAHENGSYFCMCKSCDRQFIGYKRRQICKVCATETTS